MTNLQSLSIFLTERLMLAAQEIFKAVEVTVTEYHDEISRSRQENELLKTRLLEAGIQVYPELQPGLSVFHAEPCAESVREDPGEKILVKQELSVSKEEPLVSPPPPPPQPPPPPLQTSVSEEPMSPRACLEDEQKVDEMLHPQMTDRHDGPLLQAQQCMQIKEEINESKSALGTEIFCLSQSSEDPSSAIASGHVSGLDAGLDELSMHNAPEMPLRNKEKSAHYRQQVNSDPKARAEYLAKRKESYQRRKQMGMIKSVKCSDLTETERKKKRAQWRAAPKNYRERKTMGDVLFDIVPLSVESTLPLQENADVNGVPQEQSVQAKILSLKAELSPLSWCPPDQRLPLSSRVNAGQPKRCINYEPAVSGKELQRRERYSMIRARGIGKVPRGARERKMEPMAENERACRKKQRLPEVLMLEEEQCMPSQLCISAGSMNERNIQPGHKPPAVYQSDPEANLCVVCGRSFSSRGLLKVHLRVHSGERPYHCPYCDKNFRQSSHLSVHIRIHTGEKPYSCLSCGKRFSDRSACNRHVKAHLENAELGQPT